MGDARKNERIQKRERKKTDRTRDGRRTGSPQARAGFGERKQKERNKPDRDGTEKRRHARRSAQLTFDEGA